MNKRKFPVTNIGSVSLLMIFIVLCMVTLAALSLSTASGSYRSAQTLAGHTTAYYRASNKAEKKACRDREDPAGMLSFHFRCRQLLSTGASTAWNHRQRRIPDLFFSDSCQQVTGTGSPDPDHLSGQFRYSRV